MVLAESFLSIKQLLSNFRLDRNIGVGDFLNLKQNVISASEVLMSSFNVQTFRKFKALHSACALCSCFLVDAYYVI